jgi:transposase-like protein
MPFCPRCCGEKVIRSGSIHKGKPKFSCKDCRRQFVENPSNKIIPKEPWNRVDKLFLEKISAAGISRVTRRSAVWIQEYINKKQENLPKASGAVFKKAV